MSRKEPSAEREFWTQAGLIAVKLILPRLIALVFGDGNPKKKKRIRGRTRYQIDKRLEASRIRAAACRPYDYNFPEDFAT